MIIKTNAKINLTLDIVGKRDDGYHLLRSIMHPIPLYDTIAMAKTGQGIKISCNLPYIPTDERNLVHKAANLFFDETATDGGLSITLEKRVPAGAGLGGGSANAAGILVALNQLYNKGLTTAELCALGVRLGADVPFFIENKPQLAEGIGEILTPVPPLPPCKILLVMPAFSVNTKWAYQNLDLSHTTPQTDAMLTALNNGNLEQAAKCIGNHMESSVIKGFPKIDSYKKALLKMGALGAVMSGSGSSVFGIFHPDADMPNPDNYFKNCKYIIMDV